MILSEREDIPGFIVEHNHNIKFADDTELMANSQKKTEDKLVKENEMKEKLTVKDRMYVL